MPDKIFSTRSVTPSRMPQLPEPAAHWTQQEKYVVSLVIDSFVIIIIYYSQYSASYVNNKSCSLWQPILVVYISQKSLV